MPARPIFYIARLLPGYRLPILSRLNERLDGRLVVCTGQPPGTSSLSYLTKEQSYDFPHVSLHNYWLMGERVHLQPFRKAFKAFGDPAVVLTEESPRSISLPRLLIYARQRGAGRVLWGHFSSLNRRFDPTQHMQDRYRLALARRVEACACYTQGVADHLRPYLPDKKLFVARNTIGMDTLFAQYDALAKQSKMAVRQELGLAPDAAVLAFMGRLVPEKGTQLLLETFAHICQDRPAALLVIGAGPEREAMEAYTAQHHLPDVHFLGPLPDEEAAPYLYAADVMLMPGYLGLVINHAFAFGLPVVSRRKPVGVQFHSPEVEYVQSGKTGLLSEGDGATDLAEAVRTVLLDQARFSANALDYARTYLGVDHMVDGLEGAIRYATAQVGAH
ncbi:MAG TPA: glycosyltransferase [Rhodothermales bacterium]|nr:glycosyltransferase [Rhodothermales bacterium]